MQIFLIYLKEKYQEVAKPKDGEDKGTNKIDTIFQMMSTLSTCSTCTKEINRTKELSMTFSDIFK